jgi:hypothetical protein
MPVSEDGPPGCGRPIDPESMVERLFRLVGLTS